jgi:hypothetical protein
MRELRAEQPDCASLNGALVVVLATLITAPAELELRDGEAREDHETERERGAQLAVGASGNVAVGLLPDVFAGGSLLLGIRWSRLAALWLDATLWPGAETLDRARRGVRMQAVQLGAALCPELVNAPGHGLALCAGAQAVGLRGQGEGLGVERSALRAIAQLTGELAYILELGSGVHARVALGSALALNRPRFYFEQGDGRPQIAHRPALLSGALRVGIIIGAR